MIKIFIFILMFCVSKLSAQEINWQQTSDWKLYDGRGIKGFDLQREKILSLKFVLLDTDTIKNFILDAAIIPPDKAPLWMGNYLASCKNKEGELEIIYISTYGSFFYFENEKKYYLLPEELKKEWLDYLAEKESTLQMQNEQ